MTTIYKISEEQLESLIDNATSKDLAYVIGTAVRENEFRNPQEPTLPRNPEHGENNGLVGLKRIHKWLGWEMSYNDYRKHSTKLQELQSILRTIITTMEPGVDFITDVDGW